MQVSPMAIVYPMANGMIAMAAVSAMSSAAAAGGLGGFAAFGGMGPREELESIEVRIRKLSYVLENQRNAVVGHREHKIKLMKEYGVYVLPSEAEMRTKYRKLYFTDKYLRVSERELDKMELNMMRLQKRRKELRAVLGMRAEEEPKHVRYPAMKKFKPPPGLGD